MRYLEVDWTGATIAIHDSATGEIAHATLFVDVLSRNGFAYAELCVDMKVDLLRVVSIVFANWFAVSENK